MGHRNRGGWAHTAARPSSPVRASGQQSGEKQEWEAQDQGPAVTEVSCSAEQLSCSRAKQRQKADEGVKGHDSDL